MPGAAIIRAWAEEEEKRRKIHEK